MKQIETKKLRKSCEKNLLIILLLQYITKTSFDKHLLTSKDKNETNETNNIVKIYYNYTLLKEKGSKKHYMM